jgi:hypothetical protein
MMHSRMIGCHGRFPPRKASTRRHRQQPHQHQTHRLPPRPIARARTLALVPHCSCPPSPQQQRPRPAACLQAAADSASWPQTAAETASSCPLHRRLSSPVAATWAAQERPRRRPSPARSRRPRAAPANPTSRRAPSTCPMCLRMRCGCCRPWARPPSPSPARPRRPTRRGSRAAATRQTPSQPT